MTNNKQIILSYAVDTSSFEFGEENSTNEIKVIPAGEWNHPQYGKITITEKDINDFIEHFEAGVRNDLPITEGHEVEDETKPAIGWFKKLINKGRDGLWAIIEWTEQGKKLIQEKSYKYFSPEFYTNYEDPETRKKTKNVLVGGALVNRPYFKSLPAIVLSEQNLINNNTMNIEEIIVKPIEELTDEEKDFLKENQEALSEEDKTKFASILEEKVEEEEKEEEKKEEEVEEEPEKENPEEKVEASEKNIMISKNVLKILEQKAELGVKASEELRKQKIENAAGELTFSEHNSKGTFLPKSKDKVVSFLLSLSDKQVEQFKEIIGELPKVEMFGELGSDAGMPASKAEQIDTLIKAKQKEDGNLSYREALDQVLAENPDLATE